MNKQQTQKIRETLAILKGQPLCFVFRFGDMICFEFGEVITKKVHAKGKNGKLKLADVQAGRYVLHIQTYCRVSAGSETLFTSGDVYQPSMALENDEAFDYEAFNWELKGNNLFDEVVAQRFSNLSDFIISRVSINRLGDTTIAFRNGYVLEILPNVSNAEECWRFFENGPKKGHLVVTGSGIEGEVNDE